MNLNLRMKLGSRALQPERANPTDAGLDLKAAEDIMIRPGELAMVDTDVAFAIPEGYVGLLFQRSSMVKFGLQLANCVGVIDSDYRGTVKAAIKNTNGENEVYIKRGDKIAQLVVLPIALPELHTFGGSNEQWEQSTNRGTGGFGSSGR